MSNPLPPAWNSGESGTPARDDDTNFHDQVMRAQPQGRNSGTMTTLEDMLTYAPETPTPPQETDLTEQIEVVKALNAEIAQLKAENAQIEELRAENAELSAESKRLRQHLEKALSATKMDNPRGNEEVERYRQMLDKARERLAQAEKELDMARAREQDYENLLEEKSEQIRKLHMQLQAHPVQTGSQGTPSEEELRQLFAELQRERQILEEDKMSMEEQYKQMELGMSRERAELGRQRSEVKRLQAELEHLKAMISRGDQAALNQLREEFQGKVRQAGTQANPARPTPPQPQQMPTMDRKAPEQAPEEEGPKKSIFGRRFFTNK